MFVCLPFFKKLGSRWADLIRTGPLARVVVHSRIGAAEQRDKCDTVSIVVVLAVCCEHTGPRHSASQ